MDYVSNWCSFACSCSRSGLVYFQLLLLAAPRHVSITPSIIFYYIQFLIHCPSSDINHTIFNCKAFCSISINCLFLFVFFLCVCFSVIDQCVSQPFSFNLLKLTFFNLGPRRHSLGQNSCEDKVRVRVISTKPIGKRQHRRRKRFQWPSGSLTRLSIIPGLQRELREKKKERDASVHSRSADHVSVRGLPTLSSQTPVWQKLHWQHTHTCSRQYTSTIRYVWYKRLNDIAKTNSIGLGLWLLNLILLKMFEFKHMRARWLEFVQFYWNVAMWKSMKDNPVLTLLLTFINVHVNLIVQSVTNLQVRVKKDEERWTVFEKVTKVRKESKLGLNKNCVNESEWIDKKQHVETCSVM